MDFSFIDSPFFITYGIPILIVISRITDVTIGTLRIIFVAKGLKLLAPILGFFEVTIWILAVTKVMANLDNYTNIFAYALGFSLGNYIGMYIESRLAIGMVVLRIITKKDSFNLIEELRKRNYSVTVADAQGNMGAVNIVFSVIKRADIKSVIPLIERHNPQAVYSIEDVRFASDPNFSLQSPKKPSRFSSIFRGVRK